MKRKNLLIVGLLFATVLFTSCGGPTATPVATSVPASASPAATNTFTVPATSTSTTAASPSAPTATVASTATSAPTTTSTLAPSAASCPAGTYYGAGTNQSIAVQMPTSNPSCKLTDYICAHGGKHYERFFPATCSCGP